MLNLKYMRNFKYLEIHGGSHKSSIDLYATLVHEIIHVVSVCENNFGYLHNNVFYNIARKFISKINLLTNELPVPFTGLLLDPRKTLHGEKFKKCN